MQKKKAFEQKCLDLKCENEMLLLEIARLKEEKKTLEQQRDQYLKEIMAIRESKTYQLARGITFLPRKLRSIKYVYSRAKGNQVIYPYMISVVIAVYNTKDFLVKMIDTIINQKHDMLDQYLLSNESSMFRFVVYDEVYELILVDDGSSDGSGDICDAYAQNYPFVKVVHKEHEGAASARNVGIDIAQGKYITFPDSDDKLSVNVFQDCFLFFEAHEKEVSLVTYPLRFFDGQEGDHWTTYRFDSGTRILNILEEWDKPQYFTAASFFKTEDVQRKISFDCGLINGEDIKFVNEVIFRGLPKIGLVSTCTYWYRRRSVGEQSVIQKSKNTKQYYCPYVVDVLGWLMKTGDKQYGRVPKYVQYTVMGQLQWRIRSDSNGAIAKQVIGENSFKEYRKLIKELIKQIELDVILTQRQLLEEHLFWLCKVKTEGNFERRCENNNVQYYFEGRYCVSADNAYLRLEFMEIKDGILYLKGCSANFESDCSNWVQIGEKRLLVETCEERNINEEILGETALYVQSFVVKLSLLGIEQERMYFISNVHGTYVKKTQVFLGESMPFTQSDSTSYYCNEGWMIRIDENVLDIYFLG